MEPMLMKKTSKLSFNSRNGDTALVISARNKAYHCIDYLIDNGANPNEKNK